MPHKASIDYNYHALRLNFPRVVHIYIYIFLVHLYTCRNPHSHPLDTQRNATGISQNYLSKDNKTMPMPHNKWYIMWGNYSKKHIKQALGMRKITFQKS